MDKNYVVYISTGVHSSSLYFFPIVSMFYSSFLAYLQHVRKKIKRKKKGRQLIHSARPTVPPVANIVFTLFCFARFWKVGTNERTTCAKTMILIVGWPSGTKRRARQSISLNCHFYAKSYLPISRWMKESCCVNGRKLFWILPRRKENAISVQFHGEIPIRLGGYVCKGWIFLNDFTALQIKRKCNMKAFSFSFNQLNKLHS